MWSKRKEHKERRSAEKATCFFIACKANLATRLSIPAAMRARMYADVKAID